jgi:PPIC-type PPIASE domain
LLRRKAEREYIATEYMRSRIIPKILLVIGPKEVKAEYDSHPNEYVFPGLIKWQDVFVPAGEKEHPTVADTHRYAQWLLNQHRDNFKALLPFDKGDSIHRGGQGVGTHPTYQRSDKTIPTDVRPAELEIELIKMNEGEVKIVEMSTGVHIIRLEKYQRAEPRPFNQEVQKEISNRLRGEVFERELKYLQRELRDRADIVIVAD